MIVTVPSVLSPEQVAHCREVMSRAAWVDGRATSGYQSSIVKKNRQITDTSAEARELGLRDTHYTSPSGIRDRGNYSTPWDLAALTRYAFRNPRFNQLVRTKEIHVRWVAPTNSKIYVNNNFLLRLYTGANGVKTGYTDESGWCLVASATKHGRRLIAVILDSPNMYADARRLLNLGFSH